jgi:hypothetical protein
MHPCLVNNRFYKSGFLGLGGSTPQPSPPPPVPTANTSAAAAVQQQALHADPNGVTYASTLLTGAASPVTAGSVSKSTLLGGN